MHVDYHSRLISLHLLPLMYIYELQDILFLISRLKFPDPCFPVSTCNFISFSYYIELVCLLNLSIESLIPISLNTPISKELIVNAH